VPNDVAVEIKEVGDWFPKVITIFGVKAGVEKHKYGT